MHLILHNYPGQKAYIILYTSVRYQIINNRFLNEGRISATGISN